MKQGSDYAKRIRRLYHSLLRSHGKPAPAEATDPVDQMIIGILALDSSIPRAQTTYKRLRQQTVDLNELRVTPAMELAEMIGDGVGQASRKAQRIVDALNAVRRRQDTLDLAFLKLRGRREAREYLESLDGVGPAVAGHVVLFSLGGHAIPVDALTLYVLRKEHLVHPEADASAVQTFLERCIGASEAADFVHLVNRYVTARAPRVDVDKLPSLLAPATPAKEVPPAVPAAPVKGVPPAAPGAAARPAASKAKEPEKRSAKQAARTGGSGGAAPRVASGLRRKK